MSVKFSPSRVQAFPPPRLARALHIDLGHASGVPSAPLGTPTALHQNGAQQCCSECPKNATNCSLTTDPTGPRLGTTGRQTRRRHGDPQNVHRQTYGHGSALGIVPGPEIPRHGRTHGNSLGIRHATPLSWGDGMSTLRLPKTRRWFTIRRDARTTARLHNTARQTRTAMYQDRSACLGAPWTTPVVCGPRSIASICGYWDNDKGTPHIYVG